MFLLCGIGDPSQALHTTVSFLGREPEKVLAFPDHYDFRKEAEKLRALSLPIVCTGKDAVKLAALSLPLPCFSLEVSARFFASLNVGEKTLPILKPGGKSSSAVSARIFDMYPEERCPLGRHCPEGTGIYHEKTS